MVKSVEVRTSQCVSVCQDACIMCVCVCHSIGVVRMSQQDHHCCRPDKQRPSWLWLSASVHGSIGQDSSGSSSSQLDAFPGDVGVWHGRPPPTASSSSLCSSCQASDRDAGAYVIFLGRAQCGRVVVVMFVSLQFSEFSSKFPSDY